MLPCRKHRDVEGRRSATRDPAAKSGGRRRWRRQKSGSHGSVTSGSVAGSGRLIRSHVRRRALAGWLACCACARPRWLRRPARPRLRLRPPARRRCCPSSTQPVPAAPLSLVPQDHQFKVRALVRRLLARCRSAERVLIARPLRTVPRLPHLARTPPSSSPPRCSAARAAPCSPAAAAAAAAPHRRTLPPNLADNPPFRRRQRPSTRCFPHCPRRRRSPSRWDPLASTLRLASPATSAERGTRVPTPGEDVSTPQPADRRRGAGLGRSRGGEAGTGARSGPGTSRQLLSSCRLALRDPVAAQPGRVRLPRPAGRRWRSGLSYTAGGQALTRSPSLPSQLAPDRGCRRQGGGCLLPRQGASLCPLSAVPPGTSPS